MSLSNAFGRTPLALVLLWALLPGACGTGSSGGSASSTPTTPPATQTTCSAAKTASGSLDPAFGTAGYVQATNPNGGLNGSENNQILATAVDSQCRIVAAGSSTDAVSGNSVLAVWRFTPTGALDTSFASGGLYTKANTGGGLSPNDVGHAVAIDSLDNIIIAGETNVPSSGTAGGAVVWRLTSSGAVDPAFNASGSTPGINLLPSLALGTTGDILLGVALDSTGNILVSGLTGSASSNFYNVVARLSGAGVLDTASFGNLATTGVSGVFGVLASSIIDLKSGGLAIDTANPPNIWIAGGSTTHVEVWKVLPNGANFDTSFGSGGGFSQGGTLNSGSPDFVLGFTRIAGTGQVVAIGSSQDASSAYHSVAWALNSAGLDTTHFAVGKGYVAANGAGTQSNVAFVDAVAGTADSSGRLVLAGLAGPAFGSDSMAVWRYTAAGLLDTTFNATATPGSVAYAGPFGGPRASAKAITLDSAGNLVVGGVAANGKGGTTAMVWRIAP